MSGIKEQKQEKQKEQEESKDLIDNTTVVIPTTKPYMEVETIDSIPDRIIENHNVRLRKEKGIATARNLGVHRTFNDYIIQLDDDIRFSEDLFYEVLEKLDKNTVIGMEDWDFNLIVTRFIAFHRQAFKDVGGFDTLLGSHMEDTDFAIKLEKKGYNIEKIDQDRIEHIDHESRINTYNRAWRLLYLSLKHPKYAPKLIKGVL